MFDLVNLITSFLKVFFFAQSRYENLFIVYFVFKPLKLFEDAWCNLFTSFENNLQTLLNGVLIYFILFYFRINSNT